ncbi:hypothetical protein dqs_3874 [Azoarcus olearius]|uniref:hypothetical protein n=1 Tax=Azoarcus sp. (strain BH72) TaxID=418699 RepID=UPI0008060A41|nr:hypothetical protein [Azoarcus olearius]ANQ86891.1 hypothetical protein dqs_3874 [Azoarcus olearius]
MRRYQRGTYFRGCINIRPTLAFEATVAALEEALGVSFSPDDEGKYEEFPAYRAFALGLELALLAPPRPEDDVREVKDDSFQLLIQTRANVTEDGADIDLSALIEAQLNACTGLTVERMEHIDAP